VSDEIRAARLAALETFAAEVATVLAGAGTGPLPLADQTIAGRRPVLEVRAWSGDAANDPPASGLLAPGALAAALPEVDVVAGPSAGGVADWVLVVAPVFDPGDPDALGRLIRRAAGSHARTTVLVDVGRLGDGAVGADAPVVRAASADPALRLVARRFVAVDVDLWRRALELHEADGRALAALALGDRAALQADLAGAARFLAGDVGRAAEVRARAFERFGLTGLRVAFAEPASLRDVESLRSALLDAAGAGAAVGSLRRDLVDAWPAPAELRVTAAVAGMVASLRLSDRSRARDLAERLGRFEQGSEAVLADGLRRRFDLAPLSLRPELHESFVRIAGGSTPAERVGLDASASSSEILVAAAHGAERWRALASSPLTEATVAAFAESVARWFEVVCLLATPGRRA